MVIQPILLAELEIIGYADFMDNPRGPLAVPPVFQNRAESLFYVPPFRINGNWLTDPKCILQPELDDLVHEKRITLLDQPIPGKINHQLWLNESNNICYEETSFVKQQFNNIFVKHLNAAIESLKSGDIQDTQHSAETALSAKSNGLEPRVLLAACYGLKGDEQGLKFMLNGAKKIGHSEKVFVLLLKTLIELISLDAWITKKLDYSLVAKFFQEHGMKCRITSRVTEKELSSLYPLLLTCAPSVKQREFLLPCDVSVMAILKHQEFLQQMYDRSKRTLADATPFANCAAMGASLCYEAEEIASSTDRRPEEICTVGNLVRKQLSSTFASLQAA